MASPSELRLTVRFFAAARERAKTSSCELKLPAGATVQTALDELVQRYPLASLLPQLRVALAEEFVTADTPLTDGAELALIPPVAGGAPGLFRVVDRPLDLAEVIAAVQSHARGGLVTFSGVVRDVSKGKRITRLEYEAYTPMAERKLAQLGDEARAKWPEVQVAVLHRVGVLQPGETAVVIAAAAPHRKQAFLACEYVIDRLKEDVPIWKKEFAEDGEVWVGLGP
jgi:molybdopterin synthase catalytic subunit